MERVMACPHKPHCPDGTPTWNCGKRTAIETAMFRRELNRADGERLLRTYGLPIKPMSATEKYNRDEERRGLLF